jgi:hypothetical protein
MCVWLEFDGVGMFLEYVHACHHARRMCGGEHGQVSAVVVLYVHVEFLCVVHGVQLSRQIML